MRSNLSFKLPRWRDAVAVLTTAAIFTTSTGALAQSQQNESGQYEPENVAHYFHGDPQAQAPRSLQTQTDYSEARNNGLLLRVWRADQPAGEDAQVWASFAGFGPVPLGTTATHAAPIVVPYGDQQFMVFHTGVDGHIYYTIVIRPTTLDGHDDVDWDRVWVPLPFNQTTNVNMAVSAVAYKKFGTGSSSIPCIPRRRGRRESFRYMV